MRVTISPGGRAFSPAPACARRNLALPWNTSAIARCSSTAHKATKAGRPPRQNARSARLLAPLAANLAAWRLASERSGADLVFPTVTGEPVARPRLAQLARRVFDPPAKSVGATGTRPYDLRHAFCSLLIAEGLSVVEVACQAGHAPTMMLDT